MKKIIGVFFAIVFLGVFCIPVNAAEKDINERIKEYLLSEEGQKEVVNKIGEVFSYISKDGIIYKGVSGELEISEPFMLPFYNKPTGELCESYDRYSFCYSGDNAVGLLRYISGSSGDIGLIYYVLPDDFSPNGYSLFSYEARFDTNGDVCYGGSPDNIFLAANSNEPKLIYHGNFGFKSLVSKVESYFPPINYEELKQYNHFEKKPEVVCTVNIPENITGYSDEFSCLIINSGNGKALTYRKGKLTLESTAEKTDAQIFIISESKNGYVISPKSDTSKKIIIRKNESFDIMFSYFGQSVCKISGSDSRVIKSKDDKIVYGSCDDSDADCYWMLIEEE